MIHSRKRTEKERPDPSTLPLTLPNLNETGGTRAALFVHLINASHKYSIQNTKIIRPDLFGFMLDCVMKFDTVAIKTTPGMGTKPAAYSLVFIKPAEKGRKQIQATAIQFTRQNIPEELAGKFYLTLESFRNRSNIEAVLFGVFVE